MFYKCNYCDPTTKRGQKPVKSINTDTDEFIKDEKGKHYHLDCYKLYLKDKKKMTDSQVDFKVKELLDETRQEMKEKVEKDNFLKWIMEFYDGSLPSYFLLKLKNVRDGEYKGLNEPIDYETLLDIYKHMENYLRKLRAKKHIDNVTQQMNYDLAVVIGNYGDYKRYKNKTNQNIVNKEEVNRQIKIEQKVSNLTKIDNQEEDKSEDFDLTDIIDELIF